MLRKPSEEIAVLDDDVRASGINNRRAVWADLKELLGDLSSKKCWYCEANQRDQTCRSTISARRTG